MNINDKLIPEKVVRGSSIVDIDTTIEHGNKLKVVVSVKKQGEWEEVETIEYTPNYPINQGNVIKPRVTIETFEQEEGLNMKKERHDNI